MFHYEENTKQSFKVFNIIIPSRSVNVLTLLNVLMTKLDGYLGKENFYATGLFS